MGNTQGGLDKSRANSVAPNSSTTSTRGISTTATNLKEESPNRMSENSISKQKKVTFSEVERVSQIEALNSKRRRNVVSTFCSYCTAVNLLSCLKERIPVISWIAEYKLRNELIPDIIAGVTISMMQIPQGLVYAVLAEVDPAVGMYMGVLPVIAYFLLGTSRHASVGTFAIVSLMTGKIIIGHMNKNTDKIVSNSTSSITTMPSTRQSSTNIEHLQIAIAISAMVGIWFLILFFCNLGRFSLILSKTLVNSFTAAAAIHVIFSQIATIFGLKIKTNYDIFGLIIYFISITKNIVYTSVATLVLALITFLILLINMYLIKPQTMKRWGVSPPIEIIVIILFTVLSKYLQFSEKFYISIVGYIPTGFPPPSVPKPTIMWAVFWESFVLVLVSYSVSISVAFMLASKCDYDVNPQQELFAFGVANLVGSFFSCFPIASSLSRSLMQLESGGRTQIASMVSCTLLIIAILFIGPHIEHLPLCVLSAIIVVSIKGMLFQIADFPAIWKASTLDGLLWLITFFSVVLVDIVYGLAIAVLFALISIYYRSTIPIVCKVGKVTLASPDDSAPEEIFVDLKNTKVSEIPGTKIIQITSEYLNFANKKYTMKKIQELAGVSPKIILELKKELERRKIFPDEVIVNNCERLKTVEFRLYHRTPIQSDITDSTTETYSRTRSKLNNVIVDLSLVKKFDHSAMLSIKLLVKLYQDINIGVIVVSSDPMLMKMIETMPSLTKAVNNIT